MNKKELESKFKEYLNQKWENSKKLDETKKRFWNNIYDIFFDWLEDYRKNNRSYNEVFNQIVLPKMKLKIEKNFWNIYFKEENYKKYKELFISFMIFSKKNSEYINNLMFDKRKEKLEKSVDWVYWNFFNKEALIHAWHTYIKNDKWENWDKFREYLTSIYWSLNNENLKILYEIFFDSYEICSKINMENINNKENKNFEKKEAFNEAFFNLTTNLPHIKSENLEKIKSLFWKYLNFIPRYRKEIIENMWLKPKEWENIQKDTEKSLLDNLSMNSEDKEIKDQKTIIDKKPEENWWTTINNLEQKKENIWIEWDWFWPIEVIDSSRNWNNWIYDQIARGDIIAPISDYWIFPDLEWENIKKSKKNKKHKRKNNQTEIDFK